MTTFALTAAAAVFATGSDRTAAVNNIVIVLRIGVSFSLEGELLGVDEGGGDVGTLDVSLQGGGQRRRPAEVDLALGNVRNELAQMPRREQPASCACRVVADDEQEPHAAVVGHALELDAEDDVGLVDDAVDDHDVTAHVFHQRPDRRDANAAADWSYESSLPVGIWWNHARAMPA